MARKFFVHEYVHTLQSRRWGPLYLLVPSLLSGWNLRRGAKIGHGEPGVEKYADQYFRNHLRKHRPVYSWSEELNKLA